MISTIFNAVGIILEIAGFVVLLFAIKSMPKGAQVTHPLRPSLK